MEFLKLIKEGATIIDVRTPGEFAAGNAPGTKNIPLSEISSRIEELKVLPQPLILCCQSGNRSGQAATFLNAHGVECYNAGSWLDVNHFLSQNKIEDV